MSLAIGPVTKTEARRFVNDHHRHNEAPNVAQCTLAVGLYDGDALVGVATAGNPVARAIADGYTLEINRTCVEGVVDNGNSRLYGAICRAAKALGYRKVITYTLESESGVSLRASGFTALPVDPRSWRSWEQKSAKNRVRYDNNLFGERQMTQGQLKVRWERNVAA